MVEVMVHTLNNKLQEINRNYPYTMPDCLKIMFTITSIIIAIIVVVEVIYAMKPGNCLCRKCLQNNRKNKSTNFDEFELKEISKPHGISTVCPLTCRLTVNSCHLLAQRKLPQLPNAIWDQPDSPLLHKDNLDVHNTCSLKVKETPKMKIPATPELVKNFLEDAGLDFCKDDKFKHVQRKTIELCPLCLFLL